MKKFLSALVVAGLVGSAWAGSPEEMKAMQAEMSKCMVCKHLAAKMDAIGPMSADVVHLDNGVAIQHHVKNMVNLPVYRAASAEMATAGGECMKLSDADAKTKLCPMCQDMRSAAMKGAVMSHGETKSGSMMVLTSADPVVQKDLHAIGEKCAMMMGANAGAAKDAHAGHKH